MGACAAPSEWAACFPSLQEAAVASRRQVAQVALAAALAFSAAPAKAFLGIGEGQQREEEYTSTTVSGSTSSCARRRAACQSPGACRNEQM